MNGDKELDADPYQVVLYYKYVQLGETEDEIDTRIQEHEKLCNDLQLTGRVRIAKEGINGTLGGTQANVQEYIKIMNTKTEFQHIDWKTSASRVQPFPTLIIRKCQEIVAMEIPDQECNVSKGGIHLSPQEFHTEQQACAQEDIAIIDVRNSYEYNIGHFQGAMNPNTRRFGQFPAWVQSTLPELKEKQKVFMYCTGGIRCEKASAYLKHCGIENVYQLSGGIHRYLEEFPDGGLFQGKNFVFDERISMASSDSTVAGRCENCPTACDVVSGTRCQYCRIHVLLCDTCQKELKHSSVYCKEHRHLVTGTLGELIHKSNEMENEIQNENGKNKKGRRRSLRKQINTINDRINELKMM